MNPRIIARSTTLGDRTLEYIVQVPHNLGAGTQSLAGVAKSASKPQLQPKPKPPLLISLHGSGGHVTIDKLIAGTQKSLHLEFVESDFADSAYPLIIFAPRIPDAAMRAPGKHLYWEGTSDLVMAALDEIIRDFDIDEDRVYLAGFSMGGYGTWNIAAKHPDRFAAIIPAAGWTTFAEAEIVKDLPIWIFHTSHDELIPFMNAKHIYEHLLALGADVRMTVTKDAHTPDATLFSEGTLRWLLTQNRPNNHRRLLALQAAETQTAQILATRPIAEAFKVKLKEGATTPSGSDWSDCGFYILNNLVLGTQCASGEFALLYDDSNLYVCIMVRDVPAQRPGQSQNQESTTSNSGVAIDKNRLYPEIGAGGLNTDSIDLYFDFFNTDSPVYTEGCIKFRITRGDQKIWFGDMRLAQAVPVTEVHEFGGGAGANAAGGANAEIGGSGYYVAAAIPWPAGFDAKPGTTLGFDAQVNDTLGSPERKGSRTWADTSDTAWCQPLVFGNVKLL